MGLPEAGCFGPIPELCTRTALCLQLLCLMVSFSLTSSLFPVICSTPRAGQSGILSNHPPPSSCYFIGDPLLVRQSHISGDLVSDMRPSDTGQAWEDRLRRLRHPAGEGCCTALLPAGIGVLAALKLGFACRITAVSS